MAQATRMFRSSMYVTSLTILGSILGLTVQVLVARSFGIGSVVDAYFFSLSWPLLFAGITSSALSFTLIPKIAALALDDKANIGEYIWSRCFGLIIAIVFFSPIAFLLTWTQLNSLESNSALKNATDLDLLCLLAWISAGFLVIKNYLVAVLHGLKFHVLAATLSLFPYISMTLGLALLPATRLGIVMPLVAMIGGMVLAIVSGSIILFVRYGFFHSWTASIKSAVELLVDLPKAGLALSCFSTYSIVDAYIAPLFGAGSLTTISLIQRFIIGVGNLAISGISSVVIHIFIGQIHELNYTGFTRSVWIYTVGIFFGSLAMFSPLYFVSFEAVLGFFNIEMNDGLDVERLQSYVVTMIPGACAMLTSVVLMRVLFCFERGRVIGILIGLLWTGLYSLIAMTNLGLGLDSLTSAYTQSWLIVASILLVTVSLVARKEMANKLVSETQKLPNKA